MDSLLTLVLLQHMHSLSSHGLVDSHLRALAAATKFKIPAGPASCIKFMIIIFVVVHVGVHHLEIIQNYKMNTMFELQRLWDYWPHLRNVKVNHSLYETDCVEPLSLASTALKRRH